MLRELPGGVFTWSHLLYRLYGQSGELLYVGITNDLHRRFTEHLQWKAWWPEVADCKVEFFPSRTALETAEIAAIGREQPKYNVRSGWITSGQHGPGKVPQRVLVTEVLANEIARSLYCAGARLPTEAALGVRFGVSRITIRWALTRLADAGMLTSVQGHGWYVCVDMKTVSDLLREVASDG